MGRINEKFTQDELKVMEKILTVMSEELMPEIDVSNRSEQ